MKLTFFFRAGLVILLFLSAVACSAKRPVLYPNAHLNRVGRDVARADIDACIRFAGEQGIDQGRAEKVAGRTAAGSVVGAVTGLAVGAVMGDSGRSATAGAVGGGAGGAASGLFDSRDPDPVFKRFVERCLYEKGYETVGWK